jgi:3-hydroxyacyl-[acyl-carrier-protein] dehydratase
MAGMRFQLVDRILAVEPGRRIETVKNLSLGEEYLADHFPTFPVMPGVLMLQTVIESSAWLWRITDDFRYSIITLREAKNVKYGHFMEPGRCLRVTSEVVELAGDQAIFKAKGEADGQTTVTARVVLTRYNLRDRRPDLAAVDERLGQHWRGLHALLRAA